MTDYYELHKGQHPGWRSDEDRPACLGDGDECVVASRTFGEYSPLKAEYWNWPIITALRLPLDHWAIPALEAGYRPWAGGGEAPKDWSGGDVLLRNGEFLFARSISNEWQHEPNDRLLDIIGYPVATPKPDTGKTYPPELVERMVGLIRDLRADHLEHDLNDRVQDFVARTAAIMAEIDPPQVDPLVDALVEALNASFVIDNASELDAANVRAELAKRGLKIVEA